MAVWTVLLMCLWITTRASAQESRVRPRAREHYETMAVKTSGGTGTYQGFTNTIGIGYEVPFRYQFALAGSPLLATLHTDSPPNDLVATIRLVHLGFEVKAFAAAEFPPVFVRLGVYDVRMLASGTEETWHGLSRLLGLGYEFRIGSIGLALECAWRTADLSHGVRVTGTAPAIGVHFYDF